MKQTLSILIVLLLCVSVFTGCDNVLPQNGDSQTTDDTLNTNAECEHNWERIGNLNESTAQDKCTKCGETRLYTDPDSLSGNRLLYAMTIAETLPSCVVFEYKDEKPYCFYAYNTEGKLCRVFWNDFTGLNEKDIITIEVEGDFKVLSYDEYPDGGWTPQYEITAINVSVNSNETPKYRYSSTVVSSGKNNIQPIECFEGTTYYENGQPSGSDCGAGEVAIFDNPETKVSDFPVLVYDGDISISVSVNVTLGLIDVYDTAFQKLDYKINEIGELASLPYGEYLVTFAEQIDSRGCDAEIENYYIIDNTSLFRFVIQEPGSNPLS